MVHVCPGRSSVRSARTSQVFGMAGALFGLLTLGCTSRTVTRAEERCMLVPAPSMGPAGGTALKAEVVADGLEIPWSLAFLPDGDILFTERPGRVRMIKDGALTPPVLSLPAIHQGEGGLLGIAMDPKFEQNRFFYLYATMRGPEGAQNEVQRFRLSEDGSSARLDRVLLSGIPAAQYHDGGRLRFGPDGMLYVGTGDAGRPESAHDLGSLSGKILRMTRDGGIPEDNPFRGRLVFVRGVRNPAAFTFAPDGALIVADHGPSGEMGRTGHDEISRARAGNDLGWPSRYGCEGGLGVVTPMIVFERATPPGGVEFYTGDELGDWKGSLLVATLGSRHLHRVELDRTGARVATHEVYFAGDPPSGLGRLRDVVTGPEGAVYVTTSNCDGRGTCPRDGDKIVRITHWSPEATRERMDSDD
jgi:aldose sugar dehydrogenase